MNLLPGARLGLYEITSPLGAGGMGEVYRARDTRLNRDVAIKVLPDLFALDPDRRARFEREAQTLAALNHPNIAQIYGIEGTALVMELVEGEDLSAIIARGAVPLREALPIAKQLAGAIEAAHELGIVHRDLKPANIKVRADGAVKVLDFGLAKAMEPAVASSADAMRSPTLTARATQMGVVLGTAAYMAPEQARGRAVDKRADIWAFGVVLFEMLAGRRPFDGEDITGVMARVLERDPEWSRLPGATPPALRTVMERCLTKDPKARLRDVGEARHAIDEIVAGRSGSVPLARTTNAHAWIPYSVAVIAVAAAATGWLRPAAGPDATRLATRVELSLPDNVEFYTSPRIAADGRRVAFVGVRDGIRTVFVRDLDQAAARPIAGTDGSIFVAFSPDGRSIAIISAEARLKRLSLDSGAVEDLASGVDIVGGLSWASNDTLLYGAVTKIQAIPAAGGTPREVVAAAAGEATIASPAATPDGKTVLFTSWTGGGVGLQRPRIEAVPITGGARRVIVENAGYAVPTMPGRLLFQRNGSIYSMLFDAARVEVSGTAVKLTDEARDSPTGGVAADVNGHGDVVFADAHTINGRLTWVSLDGGVERQIPVPARSYNNPRVSPNGHTVAYSDASTIWTTDTERGAQSRIFTGSDALTGFPIWSPDGSHLFFRTSSGIVRMRADGGGQPEAIPGSVRTDYPNAVSPDGSALLITRITGATSGDIALLPVKGGDPKIVVSTPAYDGGAQFSPDGKWITYVSNTSGHMEVYLRSLDGPEQLTVSTSGGLGALWSRDGRRIYFRNAQQFLAVDVTTSPAVALSTPRLLFEHLYAFGPNITIANYSMSADGRDFLLVNPGAGRLSLIFNWLRPEGR